jgi:hypothetical protein
MKALKPVLISFTVLAYAFLAIFGLLAMNYIHMHDMSSMEHCPFMVGQQSMCSMSPADHISAFNNTVQTTLIQMVVLVLPALFAFFIIKLRPPNAFIPIYSRPRQDFFSMLFSQGILHPKAP